MLILWTLNPLSKIWPPFLEKLYLYKYLYPVQILWRWKVWGAAED